jgi:hypothetical protein
MVLFSDRSRERGHVCSFALIWGRSLSREEVAMERPTRLVRHGTVAVFGAAVFAGGILFGPAPMGRAIVSSREAASLAQRDPDPEMPLPAIDEPAMDDPAFDGPFHPPGSHRHRHHSSERPGRT